MSALTVAEIVAANKSSTYANNVKKLHRIIKFQNPDDTQVLVFEYTLDFKVE